MTPEQAMVILLTAAEGAAAAAVYAGLVYARNRKRGEEFQPAKFGSVLVVGALVGATLAASGHDVTRSSFEARWGMYAGLTVVVEGAIKAVVRYARE